MRSVLFVLSGFLFAASAQARTLADVQKAGTLKIATAVYAPFVVNENDNLSGFEIELARAVATKMNLKPEFVVRPFGPILTELNSKPDQYDLAIASHTITSTRLKDNDFAKPHYCTGGVILTRVGGPMTPKELQERTVAATSGTVQYNFLKKLPIKVEIKSYADSDSTMKSVFDRKVDAAVVDFVAGMNALKTNGDRYTVSKLLWKEEIAMAFAKNNPSLKNAVNAALAAVVADGTYAKLSQKYFGRDISCD